jgi:hypothetical protein
MIRTQQIADAVAIVKAWEIVPFAERDWFDQILRAASIARTDEAVLRHDFSLTIGIRIRRAAEGTGEDMAWFFEACSELGQVGVKGADRLYRIFDETVFNLPCCPSCNGWSGDDVEAEIYCSAGRLWSEHPDYNATK